MDGKKFEQGERRRGDDDREEAVAEVKRVKLLGASKLWTGLVTHHKDVFVSHVLSN